MADEWDAPDLVSLFELLLGNAAAAAERHSTLRRLFEAPPRPNRRNGLLRARRNIEYHYDLGNDLFELMLDETMTYSCAVWEDEGEPLADAQRRKLRRVCDKLELGPDDRVLEIGCGWGSFGILAAQERGCRVTGLTLSPSQAAFARERIRTAGVDHLVEVREEDYRTHAGSYSKVASIEMLEAIGEKQFGTYFAAIDRFLEPGGAACVQTILIPDGRWERYRRKPDWIERYIFPGCLIPSLAALATASGTHSRLLIDDVEEIGPGYAETLKRWRETFEGNLGEVRALGYDRRFERTWRFYLAFCEAGFRTRVLRDAQLTLRRAEDA
jgi:cyclopropane-fatty-acyl-phospholipid synthase